jgi:hypothetical protein
MIQDIKDMKERGYSINEIIEHYEGRPGKTPSRPTIRKYYGMDGMPEDPGKNLKKDKAFDDEPFRSAIIEIMRNNSGRCHASSVYDVLEERFVENGSHDRLPASDRTLRNYIRHLVESGEVETEPADRRLYEHVFDTPPGQQMLIDFGQQRVAAGVVVHFICMLLRYSRILCVLAQDHKYNGEEACRAIYRGFCKLGGRPGQLVIDQDAVFVSSETYGEVVKTRVFGDFLSEQDLALWVCNKADPESKGGVENLVGFVKKNFFSARTPTCVDEVLLSLPGWTERKNKRIHQATFRVPAEVFAEVEKAALRPLLPSVYENVPSSFVSTELGATHYIQYKSSKYSVPKSLCFKTALYKAIGDKLHVYGSDMKHVCTHNISPCKGSVNLLPEHAKEENTDWIPVCERLRDKWNCYDFQHFVNGFKKENPRHLYRQLSAVERFLDAKQPPKDLVAAVMAECCENFRYQFSQFSQVYELAKAGRVSPAAIEMGDVGRAEMETYQKVFEERSANP